MKITDRVNEIDGVSGSNWKPEDSILEVYYIGDLEKVKLSVASSIGNAGLNGAIDAIDYIQIKEEE